MISGAAAAEWIYTNYQPINTLNVVIFGDSVMTSAYFKHYLYDATGWDYTVLAHKSTRSFDIVSLIHSLSISKYDIAIVQCGVNNIYSPSRITNDLKKIYTYCASNNLPCIKLTLNPWGGYSSWTKRYQRYTTSVNDFIRRQSNVADVYAALDDGSGKIKTGLHYDHLHLNPAGDRILADVVLQQLMPFMKPHPSCFITPVIVFSNRAADIASVWPQQCIGNDMVFTRMVLSVCVSNAPPAVYTMTNTQPGQLNRLKTETNTMKHLPSDAMPDIIIPMMPNGTTVQSILVATNEVYILVPKK